LNPSAKYELIISDDKLEKKRRVLSGKRLMEGITLTIEQAPGSLLVFYRAL